MSHSKNDPPGKRINLIYSLNSKIISSPIRIRKKIREGLEEVKDIRAGVLPKKTWRELRTQLNASAPKALIAREPELSFWLNKEDAVYDEKYGEKEL
ncbi:MAG TPA: hypothetical protein DD738_06690 [Ruminiclostridium sp.]|jgi:hypothetical protein|nr:hypothetical protein [Ruminiclostridium sp.]